MSRHMVAILRGITPKESSSIAAVLIDAGIDYLEVPLNSPQALQSIEHMANEHSDHAKIGAGTVLDPNEVKQVHDAGGTYVVSPNCDKSVILKTKALSMESYPGVLTPTECFDALKWGADVLKLFPACVIGTSGVNALRAVLPPTTLLYAVGGINTDNLAQWRSAGADGFGIGTAIYQPGQSAGDVAYCAKKFVTAYDNAF